MANDGEQQSQTQTQEGSGAATASRSTNAKTAAAGEPKFSRERLLGPNGPRIVGSPGHVIVGALHGDEREELTREEAQQAVEKFLKRPAAPEQEGES